MVAPARRWPRRLALGCGALLAAAAVSLAGIWWWVRIPPADVPFATARALQVRVLNGEAALEAEALSALVGATRREPDNGAAQLWLGLAHLHAFLAHDRPLLGAIRTSVALDRAALLDPRDTSAAGWRAFFAYQAARSRGRGVDEARAELLEASERDPRFTPFLAAVSLARMPLESGVPEALLAPLEAIEDCGDGTSHSCRTNDLHPHGAEGYHATVGDLRVRLGDLEGGRRAYAQAFAVPSAERWPYRDAFLDWVEAADGRAAALTDGDGENDPPIFFATGERACAVCHRR